MTEKYTLIPHTDLSVSTINLGGNVFGWTSDEPTSFEVLDGFVAGGGTFIDSSASYTGPVGGLSETIIGNWTAACGNRDKVVIATKVGAQPGRKNLEPANIAATVEESLTRLQTDYIDLYYAHFDDDYTPIEDIAAAFDATVKSGKVRYIAMSNLSPARQRDWMLTAKREGLAAPVAIQPQYSLVYRHEYEGPAETPKAGYRSVAEEFDLAVFSYWSLAAGLLTGKYSTAADFENAPRAHSLKKYGTPEGLKLVGTLREVADGLSAQPASVAIAWLLDKGITAPIASARTPEQLPALFAAQDLDLPAEAVARLDEASQPFA